MKPFKEDFHIRLQAGFTPENQEQFLDLWQDIEEQIDSMQSAGMSDADILKDLGTPEDIYREYYLDLNIQAALDIQQPLIPTGDIGQVMRIKRKLKLLTSLEKGARLFLYLLLALVLLAGALMVAYLIYELFTEQHLSVSAGVILLAMAATAYGLFRLQQKGASTKNVLFVVGGLALSAAVLLLFHTVGWLQYQGKSLSTDWAVAPLGIDTMEINANIPLTLIIQNSPDDRIHFGVSGYASHKTAAAIMTQGSHQSGSRYSLLLQEPAVFNIFTRIPDLHFSLLLPQSSSLAELKIHSASGTVEINDQTNTGSISIVLDKGQVTCSRISYANLSIQTKRADILAQNLTDSTLQAVSGDGKIILQHGANLQIDLNNENGFIRLQDVTGQSASLRNMAGKSVVNDTTIESLAAESVGGALVISRQQGSTAIKSQTGDIIISDLTGDIDIANQSGLVVATQSTSVSGQVYTGSGLLRWQQRDDGQTAFSVNAPAWIVENDFADAKENPAANRVTITSDTGDVKIFRKH